MSKRVDVSGTFGLTYPAAVAFPLFTAIGEKEWIEGWDPEFVYPESGEHEDNQVFITDAGGERTLWQVVHADTANQQAQYLRITPGSRIARVYVDINDIDGGCRVAMRYLCTALSADAEPVIAEFAAGFEGLLEKWRQAATACLDRKR